MQWFWQANDRFLERLFEGLRLQHGTSVNYPPGPVEELAVYVLLLLFDLSLLWMLLRAVLRRRRDAEESRKRWVWARPLLALLPFVVLEVCLRAYVPTQPPPTYLPHPLYLWRFPASTAINLPTPIDVMRFTTNSLGLRDEEVPLQKAAGEFRVVCLGDSATFAQSVDLQQSYAKELQRLLSDAYPGRRFTVINAGMPGYSMLQGYYFFCGVAARYHPDLVVVNEFNEFSDNQMNVFANNVPRNALMRAVKTCLWSSYVYLTLRKASMRFLDPAVPRAPRQGDSTHPILSTEESVYFIRQFIARFRHLGTRAIFVLWRRSAAWDQMYADLLKDVPGTAGIVYADYHFDLLGRHGGDFWLPNDPSHHPSAHGHHYMARDLLKTIRQFGLADR